MSSIDELITLVRNADADLSAGMDQLPPDSLKYKRIEQRLEKGKSILETLLLAKHSGGATPEFLFCYKNLLNLHEKMCKTIKEAPIHTYK